MWSTSTLATSSERCSTEPRFGLGWGRVTARGRALSSRSPSTGWTWTLSGGAQSPCRCSGGSRWRSRRSRVSPRGRRAARRGPGARRGRSSGPRFDPLPESGALQSSGPHAAVRRRSDRGGSPTGRGVPCRSQSQSLRTRVQASSRRRNRGRSRSARGVGSDDQSALPDSGGSGPAGGDPEVGHEPRWPHRNLEW